MTVEKRPELNKINSRQIPLGTIDEYLAQKILEGGGKTVKISLSLDSNAGFLCIDRVSFQETEFTNGIDFELSTCECQGLDDMNILDFEGKTVYTGSAYEFFEYYLSNTCSMDCYVNFRDDIWIIKLC